MFPSTSITAFFHSLEQCLDLGIWRMNMSFPTTDAVPESQPDSPILALLLSNNLPLKSEVVIVRAKIARIEADLARYKAILSPVRCLPQEVLGLIFIYCVPEYPNLDVRQPPWTLSQVGLIGFISSSH